MTSGFMARMRRSARPSVLSTDSISRTNVVRNGNQMKSSKVSFFVVTEQDLRDLN